MASSATKQVEKAGPLKLAFHHFLQFIRVPANVILVVGCIILLYFTVYPSITLISSSFTVSSIKELGFLKGARLGDVTGYWWWYLFGSQYAVMYFYEPLKNSLLMSLLASVIAILYGGIVAFLITRTNIKGKKFLSSIFVFPYMMPSWTLATFWKNFFQNPSIGTGVGGMLYNFFHISVPEQVVYGLVPSAIVLGLHYAPFAYILIGGILKNMDANLEEAATILQASRFQIIRKITIPIVMPAILSTFLLVFASSMSAYAVPQYIGGKYTFLTTYMKSFINGGQFGLGYIMGIVLIVLGVSILLANQFMTGKRKNFTTVSGKSGQISYIDLKAGKWIVSVILIIICVFFSITPLVSFALESFCVRPGDYSTLTLEFWIAKDATSTKNGLKGIFFEPQVWKAFGNSLLLSVSCALIAGTLGVLVGYAVAKRRDSFLSKALDNLAFLPYLMPSMALGVAFLTIGKSWGLQGSMALLIIVGSIKYLPFASRSGISAMMQLSSEIEESATIQNVPWWKRMLRIIFPIQKSTFISGYILPFTSCMRELSLFVLLVGAQTPLLTTLLDEWLQWWPQSANALNLLIIITVLLINFIVNKITGASIDKGVGGK